MMHDYDCILPCILKECAETINRLPEMLFMNSLEKILELKKRNKANAVPIFMKGEK